MGKKFGYITPADMLADFYESETVRVAVAIVSVLFTILYIQVQAAGLGYILSVATGDRISFGLATAILLVVAAAYLMAGGLRARLLDRRDPGVWMYVAVWTGALVLVYKLFGGPVELWRRLVAERPDLLSLPGPEGYFTPGMWFGMTVALSFGIILQPHMMIRYYTAASAKTLKLLGATTPLYLFSLFIPIAMVGLGGALVLPDLAQPDRVFPELLFRYAPAWLTGLILAGATAAAMSTLDSILHSNMTVLTRDVYQRYIAKERSQAHYIAFGRAVVVGLLAGGLVPLRAQLGLPPSRSWLCPGGGRLAADAGSPGRLLSEATAYHQRRSRGRHRRRLDCFSRLDHDPGRRSSALGRHALGHARRRLLAARELRDDGCRVALHAAALPGDGRAESTRGGAVRLRRRLR